MQTTVRESHMQTPYSPPAAQWTALGVTVLLILGTVLMILLIVAYVIVHDFTHVARMTS